MRYPAIDDRTRTYKDIPPSCIARVTKHPQLQRWGRLSTQVDPYR